MISALSFLDGLSFLFSAVMTFWLFRKFWSLHNLLHYAQEVDALVSHKPSSEFQGELGLVRWWVRRLELEQVHDGPAVEQVQLKNAENFVQAPDDLVGELEEGEKEVDAHRDPKLRQHGVSGCSDEALHLQALLDPLEEDLHLPSRLVNVGGGRGKQLEVGRRGHVALAGVGVSEPDPAQRMGRALPVELRRQVGHHIAQTEPPRKLLQRHEFMSRCQLKQLGKDCAMRRYTYA